MNMITNLELQILAIKGISPEFIKENKSSHIYFSAELDGTSLECSKTLVTDESHYTFSNFNKLIWNIPSSSYIHLKANQPKLKIQMLNSNISTQIIKSSIFAIVDIRDFSTSKTARWVKINGMKNAELLIKTKQFELASISPELDQQGHQHFNVENRIIHESVSTLPPFTMNTFDHEQQCLFNFQLQIAQFDHFTAFCESMRSSDDSSFILTWQLFNQQFQSDILPLKTYIPSPIEDIFQIQCQPDIIINRLLANFPIKINMCKSDTMETVATATVDFSDKDIRNQAQDSSNQSVHCASAWTEFLPSMEHIRWLPSHIALPRIITQIELIRVGTSNPLVHEEDTKVAASLPAASADDTYENEEFDIYDPNKQLPLDPSASISTAMIQSAPLDVENDLLHHYRISIEIKSITQLRRPAHVVISFSYSHLGANSMIRTQAVWASPHSETKIDNGCAIYNICMTRAQLQQVFHEQPLRITVASRTHLDSSILGDALVDLSYVFSMDPISYRCIVTNKTFSTIADYNSHRSAIAALKGAGSRSIDRIPPVDPITIRALESQYTFVDDTITNDSTLTPASRLRVLIAIEDVGKVGPQIGVPVKHGYHQQGAGVYPATDFVNGGMQIENSNQVDNNSAAQEVSSTEVANKEKLSFSSLKEDFESWQRATETKWREAMREKEIKLRAQLEQESTKKLTQQVDDLKRAQDETSRLEIRLRETIDAVERQKSQLLLKEEQMNMKLAQKTAELQLLQKRVRDEAKIKIDAETRRGDALDSQIVSLKQQLEQLDRRYKEVEHDFDMYRKKQRATPETALREESAKLRAQLAESRAEVERERRAQAEARLEKEQLRSQLHRFALALKREKERNSALARQDLEQLRLEFLAREERYVLDGDREELRNIKHELAALRTTATSSSVAHHKAQHTPQPQHDPEHNTHKRSESTLTNLTHRLHPSEAHLSVSNRPDDPATRSEQSHQTTAAKWTPLSSHTQTHSHHTEPALTFLLNDCNTSHPVRVSNSPLKLDTGSQPLPNTLSDQVTSIQQQSTQGSASHDEDHRRMSNSVEDEVLLQMLNELPESETTSSRSRIRVNVSVATGRGDQLYEECITELTRQLDMLFATGMYTDTDPAVTALKQQRAAYEQLLTRAPQ